MSYTAISPSISRERLSKQTLGWIILAVAGALDVEADVKDAAAADDDDELETAAVELAGAVVSPTAVDVAVGVTVEEAIVTEFPDVRSKKSEYHGSCVMKP